MKLKIAIIFCIILPGLYYCHKDNNDYQSIGKITGADYRFCNCCGDYYIQIDSTTYEFESIPMNSNVNFQKDSFPIFVKLDWQFSSKSACPDKRITIQRITKQ
jgi:hypothetical protein